jgi:DNA repair exonuclease SbcCD ATPase subunit
LATAAIQLLHDDCPVCGQTIDVEIVRERLSNILDTAKVDAARAMEAQRAVANVQARLQASRLIEERRIALQRDVQGSLATLRDRAGTSTWFAADADWPTVEAIPTVLAQLEAFQFRLRQGYADVRRDLGVEFTRLRSEVEAADTELRRIESESTAITSRAERASALDVAARESAELIVQRALDLLAPSFAEVFDRLAPHPTFTVLRATQDIYYGKNHVVPEVYDPHRKITANPSVVFSEGQLNVVALSYFLGLALNSGDGALPFVVLDDPLQAMDVLSVLGFADLCRRLRERRQLIVTTHDRRFASLLGRKLAPRESGTRTILHEFTGWTEDGPDVRSSDEPLADIISILDRQVS